MQSDYEPFRRLLEPVRGTFHKTRFPLDRGANMAQIKSYNEVLILGEFGFEMVSHFLVRSEKDALGLIRFGKPIFLLSRSIINGRLVYTKGQKIAH